MLVSGLLPEICKILIPISIRRFYSCRSTSYHIPLGFKLFLLTLYFSVDKPNTWLFRKYNPKPVTIILQTQVVVFQTLHSRISRTYIRIHLVKLKNQTISKNRSIDGVGKYSFPNFSLHI